MTESSQLPQGPSTFADKIFGINPYSKDDPNHDLWETNAQIAAEEEAQFEAELLKRTPVTPRECARYVHDGMIGHFDILSNRLLVFKFRSAKSIAIYEDSLTKMMESMLTTVDERCPPSITKAPFLFALHRQFRQRIAHWTTEALKRMREGIATDRVSQTQALGERGLPPGSPGARPIAPGVEQESDKTTAPVEDTRDDVEVTKGSARIIGPKARRGPKAKMKFHRAVAKVVHSYGPNWKKRLEQIVRKLDKSKLQPLTAWAKRNPPARSWDRAWQHYPSVVLKAIEYSLEMAAKDITEKLSETLGNLR
jgi:hypothetical protein